tara:strand:- start:38 stop:580 length:543 start_codon:yes stop_codon:yes gene_type:complete
MYSQSGVSIASESSIIPFQFTPSTKPMLHLGWMQEDNGVRLMSGLQFQPTKNLLIGGVLSPHKTDSELSIYYHLVMGYIPQWKFLNISSNMFQIGMHRNRFGIDGDARWFNFSIMESARFGNLNLNLCLNRLFTQDWENDTIFISSDLKLSNNFYLRPGVIAYFTTYLNYTPFLFVSMDL